VVLGDAPYLQFFHCTYTTIQDQLYITGSGNDMENAARPACS
jgi:hypothetical protein